MNLQHTFILKQHLGSHNIWAIRQWKVLWSSWDSLSCNVNISSFFPFFKSFSSLKLEVSYKRFVLEWHFFIWCVYLPFAMVILQNYQLLTMITGCFASDVLFPSFCKISTSVYSSNLTNTITNCHVPTQFLDLIHIWGCFMH